ncbi:MAG: DUF1573 domain-containing protein, partial [Planctomycetota bacterium]
IARAKLGIDSKVEVRTSQGVRSPVIWCWGPRPVLLVPSTAAEADKRLDWASILCHELAHWKRRDHIAGLLAELAACVLPWNALLWWAKTQLVRLSERACDDWVLACGQAGEDYAESLLGLVPGGQMAFAPAVVSSETGLAARVRRILQERCPDPRTGVLWALAATILVGFIAAGIAFAQARPAQDPKLDEPPPIKEEDFRNQACKGILFQNAQRLIAKDKLPLLHKMLEDEAYASCWHNVARLIGYISNDPNSVPVLLHYFKRADGPNFDSIDSLAGKIWTLVFVGQIGGPQADSVLRQALTDEGAAQLAKAWIDGQLVPNTPFWDDRNSVITFIRSCAANGLVLSRKQENIDIVKRLYADCKTSKENNQLLEQSLVESLAIHDFIAENGLEAYFSLDVSATAMLEALEPYLKKYRAETTPPLTDTEPNRIVPRISFEKTTHDFGEVPPRSKNACEFKFTNTGDAMLKITRVQTTCGCTVAKLSKKTYAPGETGTLPVTYSASRGTGRTSKRIHVYSNDKANRRVTLTIRGTIVLKVSCKPERLKIMLDDANVPEITLTSTDNKPFSIKSFSSAENCITASFDPIIRAKKFVLNPKLDPNKVPKNLRGQVKIDLTHPQCNMATVPFTVVPKFKVKPPSIVISDAEPQKPVRKEVWISSNYGRDFEIESASSEKNMVRLLNWQKVDNRYKLELEIWPPARDQERVFGDVLYVNIKGGDKIKIHCRGLYKTEKKNKP